MFNDYVFSKLLIKKRGLIHGVTSHGGSSPMVYVRVNLNNIRHYPDFTEVARIKCFLFTISGGRLLIVNSPPVLAVADILNYKNAIHSRL